MMLAMIIVYQCEDCAETRVLQHMSEYDQFEETWFDGIKYQFCPKCRHRPQAEDRMAEDALLRECSIKVGREKNYREWVC